MKILISVIAFFSVVGIAANTMSCELVSSKIDCEAYFDSATGHKYVKTSNHTYSEYKLRFNGYIGHREIDPSKPAPTVTGRGDNKGGVVVLHHPNNKRRMSVRELAATQSFPLDYKFVGTQSSAYRQVANAVPPLMAEAIAKQFPLETYL